jgi:hypothetical protein
MFEDDIGKARQIEPAAWEDRPLTEKLDEILSRILQNLL